MLARIIVLWITCVCSVQAASTATVPPAVKQAVDRHAGVLVVEDGVVGVAVGVIDQGTAYFFNYGRMRRDGAPVTKQTMFEIGANTTTFTATLLAEAVTERRLSLKDRIARHLPESVTLQPATQKVKLSELATFTAGLPDLPPGFESRAFEDRDIEHYSSDDFMHFIETWEPATHLPAPYRHSNMSFGLLGYALAHNGIPGWARLLRERITAPLEMNNTVVWTTDEQAKRYAQGYQKNGESAPRWPVTAWAQANALKSTTADLVRYLAAYLGHKQVDGARVPALLRASVALPVHGRLPIDIEGYPYQQGLAWRIRLAAAGETGAVAIGVAYTVGFASFLGLNQGQRSGRCHLSQLRCSRYRIHWARRHRRH